jgi:lipopolysaccharide/colanic/teichoic acid biosynthesis glycosyltransferase
MAPILQLVHRATNVGVGFVLFILALPALFLGGLWILFEDGWPVFFSQRRVGRDLHVFSVLKLRTLKRNRLPVDEVGQIRNGHDLLLVSGRWLRRLKIDEIPQLINVLRGEMNLIGPRPTIPEQVMEYSPFQIRRQEVRPGLTGWAQVNGGTKLDWSQRIELDIWYIDHWSPVLDAVVAIRTPSTILLGERINPSAVAAASRHAEREQLAVDESDTKKTQSETDSVPG